MLRKIFVCLLLFWGVVEAKPTVMVTIAPQKFLVEQIANDTVKVEVLVPAGASSHSYEPTPKQALSTRKSIVWFRVGEDFESHLLKWVKKHTLVVDQREGLDLLDGGCSCCRDGQDPHIWLSPRLLKRQAAQIARVLTQAYPEHESRYTENLAFLLKKLTQLDERIGKKLTPKVVLVSHPAYGYFCRDYGLRQLSIEMEGKEPTPKYITMLLLEAEALGLKTVFLQEGYPIRGGVRLAKELGAEMITLNPYAENVIENLDRIASAFEGH